MSRKGQMISMTPFRAELDKIIEQIGDRARDYVPRALGLYPNYVPRALGLYPNEWQTLLQALY